MGRTRRRDAVETDVTYKPVATPTLLQMEQVECGAAALGIILRYHKRWATLRELRYACGVSRDGSKALNIVNAGRSYGMEAKGFRRDIDALRTTKPPFIVFWNFNHYVVVDGFAGDLVHINDPGSGPKVVELAEFSRSYTGIVLTFVPTPAFQPGGEEPTDYTALRTRLRGSERGLLLAVAIGLLLVLPGIANPAITKEFIDRLLIRGVSDSPTRYIAAVGASALTIGVLTWWRQSVLLRAWQRLSILTTTRFHWHVLHLPVDFFNVRYAGDIAGRAALNEQVAQLLTGSLATNAVSVIVIGLYAVVMATYSLPLTVIGVVMAALNIVALRWVNDRRRDADPRSQREQAKMTATALNGLQMMESLKATGSEADFFERWSGFLARSINARQEVGMLNATLRAAPPFLAGLTTIAILGVGGLEVMAGALSIGGLIAFQSLMASFTAPVSGLVEMADNANEIASALHQLDDVLENPTDPMVAASMVSEDSGSALAVVRRRLSGRIELREVTFGYSRLDPPLIADLSITFEPGSRVALVGGSGSGKSTVAKLVTGIYQPWSGDLLFDGRPRATYSRAVIAASLASVDQEIFLFAGTIRDNLTLWDATVAEQRVVQAARDAGIHDVIAARPYGYDGIVEEGGRNFSGGQRQRMEIARALVGDPTILVLDEATSALDPVTEAAIDEALRKRGVTCLIVAHRLSTIRDCDEIIVLDRGRVAQRGTHESLKNEAGLYAQLVLAE